MASVYLVQTKSGRVMAIFYNRSDANIFCGLLDEECEVKERTLFTSQPDYRGYNK